MRKIGAMTGRLSAIRGRPQVDVVLTKRGTKGDAHHRLVWELMLKDNRLRTEYNELKAAGMDSAQKAAFFRACRRSA
jgi:hypothetical protein